MTKAEIDAPAAPDVAEIVRQEKLEELLALLGRMPNHKLASGYSPLSPKLFDRIGATIVALRTEITRFAAELARVERERDGLRACVDAADAMRADMRYIGCACPKCASIPAYDAARAALKETP